MILPLDKPLAAQRYRGKAARLSICLRAGLPVPPGIVLHSDLVARLTHGHLTSGIAPGTAFATQIFPHG